MKSHFKNGFTLVEVIVILVILAVLAALAVPAFTGWIDRAADAALIEACHSCVLAVQGLATEHYTDGIAVSLTEAKKLAEVPGDISGVEMSAANAATVFHLTYTQDSRSVTFCGAPGTCATHSEAYTFSDTSLTLTQRFTNAGNGISAGYESLPARYQYNRIDSAALSTAGSAAAQLYATLTPEQRQTMDDYVWCTNQQAEGFRIYFAKQDEAVAGSSFTVYKYNPTTGQYQTSPGGLLTADGKLNLSRANSWSAWTDSID